MANSDRDRSGGGIKDSYVTPTLRLLFLREEHPDLLVEYGVAPADELGIPDLFRRGPNNSTIEWFVTASVAIPGGSVATGWKEVTEWEERWRRDGVKGKEWVRVPLNPELLTKLQTMALGRALKKFGIPDDLEGFKVAVTMKRRFRELNSVGAAIGALNAAPATPPATDQDEFVAALERAAVASPDYEADGSDSIPDADVVHEAPPPPRPARQDPPAPASAPASAPAATTRGIIDPAWGVPADVAAQIEATPDPNQQMIVMKLRDNGGWTAANDRFVSAVIRGSAKKAPSTPPAAPPAPEDPDPVDAPDFAPKPSGATPKRPKEWDNPDVALEASVKAFMADVETLDGTADGWFWDEAAKRGLPDASHFVEGEAVTKGQLAEFRALFEDRPF